VHIIGFDISGTATDALDVFGSYNLLQGNHVHHVTGAACNEVQVDQVLVIDTGANNIFDGIC